MLAFMILADEHCYRALRSRDSRFDGRFFTAVQTTGIYCRPVCPAATPKRRNIRFFPCAAAAEEAGFRACKRCRPETAPGTPAWQGTSATVRRALRLIEEGALDESGVELLAARVGVGGRHLRRLFVEHLGASPLAIALTQRTHLARRLIDETTLPMARVAFSSGFQSVRQFNDAIRKSFALTPTQIRRGAATKAEGSELRLRLAYKKPFDWHGLLDFLRFRAIPGVEAVDNDSYRRTVGCSDASGFIRLTNDPGHAQLLLELNLKDATPLVPLVDRVRRVFDLRADPVQIGECLKRSRLLKTAFRPGLRVPGAWDPFEVGVRAILGQQISVAAATTLAGRLVERFGRHIDSEGENALHSLFPEPEDLISPELGKIGLPSKRADAIRNFARSVAQGDLRLDSSLGLEDSIERLCRVDGIGPWTAHYVAMRAFGETDAFPASDLGIRHALAIEGKLPSEKEVMAIAEEWRPWRAYAAVNLWSVRS